MQEKKKTELKNGEKEMNEKKKTKWKEGKNAESKAESNFVT